MTDVRNMRKLMESIEEWQQVGEDYSESSEERLADELDDLIKDIQQLEEDTLRVYQECVSEESKARPDYTEMLLNELRETIKQITEIARKYD